MTEPTCPTCTRRPLPPGRTICTPCINLLRTHLDGMSDLMRALDDAIGRRLRFTTRNGSKSANTPLPVNMQASDRAYQARTSVLTWTDYIATARHEATPDTWTTIERFLDVRAHWLATQEAGPEALEAITAAVRTAASVVDRPADTHYAGPCTATTVDVDGLPASCTGELYAQPSRATVACPRCGSEYEVAARREWLLAEAWEAVATGPDITRALAGEAFGGLSVSLSTIRTWAADGRLVRVDSLGGRPRYRVGDVLELAIGAASRPGARRAGLSGKITA